MRITSTGLARFCVALLILYPVSAFLVWSYLDADSYGLMAALFATNAGTAVFVGLVFNLSELSRYTSRALRLSVVLIGVVSGLISALFWMTEEVDHIWLQVVIMSPVLVILLVLMWFIAKTGKEETKLKGEE